MSRALSGHTRVAAVIGNPVRHSLSPALHNAAFAALDLDWAYVAFEVADGHGGDAVAAMRTLGLAGLSVTMPHKDAVAAAVDRCSATAAALGAVNCVAWEGAELVGHNTDGDGFVASLRAEGIDPAGRRCVVLGAGGAGRAVVHALADAGAAEVVVVNRSAGRAQQAAALAGAVGRVGTAADVDTADLLVNATPVGMGSGEGAAALPVDPDRLHARLVVADLVYHPEVTPLLATAAERGCRTVGGVGMLVHQAALAFELWTGLVAPVPAMLTAVRAALAARASG